MAFVVTAAVALLLIELFLRRRPWAIALTAAIAVIATIPLLPGGKRDDGALLRLVGAA